LNYKIVIIGVGQIGSRHLQGLTKSSKNFQVFVVDIDKKALRIAKRRYIEASKQKIDNNVSYHQSLSEIPDNLDFAIIATTANVRRPVIENLLTKKTVRYLLFEKIVFQKSEDFLPIQCLLNDQGTKAWVNCSRRSYSYYKELKKEINKEIIKITVEGNHWNMACNSIHMIDIIVYLTGQTDLTFNTFELDDKIYSASRDGYQELYGKFIITTGRGDILEMINRRLHKDEELKITVKLKNKKVIIDELRGLSISNSPKSSFEEKQKIKIPFQSEITGMIVDQILETGESDLTPYNECMKYHIPMLDAFNSHFSKISGKIVKECPIT
jgi:hypothetical protein